MTRPQYTALLIIGMLVANLSCEQPPASESALRKPAEPKTQAEPLPGLVSSGHLYVPIYSHIYTRGGLAEDLAVTLSVRNMSIHRSLVLESVRYYDTGGEPLQDFLKSEAILGPLETVEFFVSTQDQRGGSGANVVVAWHSDSKVVKPLVEAVMVSSGSTNKAFAFATRALELPDDSTPGGEDDAAP